MSHLVRHDASQLTPTPAFSTPETCDDRIKGIVTDQPYVTLKAAAPWTEASAERLIAEAREEAQKQRTFHILLDLRDWLKPDTEMTRFWSGVRLAEGLRKTYRVAAFAHPQAINRFGEDAARNRGAEFQIFYDEASALKWLLKEGLDR